MTWMCPYVPPSDSPNFLIGGRRFGGEGVCMEERVGLQLGLEMLNLYLWGDKDVWFLTLGQDYSSGIYDVLFKVWNYSGDP